MSSNIPDSARAEFDRLENLPDVPDVDSLTSDQVIELMGSTLEDYLVESMGAAVGADANHLLLHAIWTMDKQEFADRTMPNMREYIRSVAEELQFEALS